MKKQLAIILALMLAFAPVLFAANVDVQDGGTHQGRARALNFTDGITATLSGGVADVSVQAPLVLEGTTADDYETTVALTDPTADRTVTIPNKSGQVQLASAASVVTSSATSTLTVGLSNVYTYTPTDNQDSTMTFSAAGTAGDILTLIIITQGTADEVITFHATLVASAGTITAGTTAAREMVVTFISSGTRWYEIARTSELT